MMSREKKGKQPQIHIHLNQSKSRDHYSEPGPSESLEVESLASPSPTTQRPDSHQKSQSRRASSIQFHQGTSTYLGSSARAPSPLGQPLTRRPFVSRSTLPTNTSYRPTEASTTERATLDRGEYPVDDSKHPVVPDFLPSHRTQLPDTSSKMNSHSNYYSQGAAPGRSTPFPQRLRPADDPEIMQLKAELEAYRIIEEKAKTEEEQKKKEDKIRQDTEVAFQLRWEALQKAQEDTKREMERIKKEAEAAAWERVEKERREQESMRVREQHQARVMESEIRTKIEVERKAEEQERRSREKLESEIEMRLKKKMMDKVDELMRDFEQRLSIYPPVWPYQTGTQNQKELSCSQPETQLMNGYEPPQTWQPGLNGHHTRDAALCSPAPSQSPRTGYPPSNANLSHGVRLPSVPCASDPSQSPEEWSPQNSRFYRNSQADFFPHPSSPSRGRIRNQSQGYSTWQPYQEEYIGTRMHAHPELIQELAYAVNEVLRDQIFNGMTMRRDMDDRQHNHYSSSVHQVPVDPRAYSYAPDRAAAMEAQRQRQREREYQNGRSRQFGPPQGMMNGQGYGFERPAPSPSMMPQNRLSSTGGTFSVDRTSESSKAQSAYQTPPQSYRGAVLVTGNRPNASTTASTLCKAGEKNCESDQRGLPAPGDERLQTHVNQFLEVPSGNSKVEKQLSAANAYMDFKET